MGLERSKFWLTVLNNYFLAHGKKWLTGCDITVADYFCGSVVALGEMIGTDFSKYPRVQAWLKNVKGPKHWGAISAELDGFAAYVKDQNFVKA
jgi:glutathione S-transferase